MLRSVDQHAFFLPGRTGRLFVIVYMPGQVTTHGIIFFPPFAEEMNKSRRMMNLTARRLASVGYTVLMMDLFGTGDSDGDFGDASWEIWKQDISAAMKWFVDNGVSQVDFLGLRTGALLAASMVGLVPYSMRRLVLWAPVIDGGAFVSQFLRVRMAADMLARNETSTMQKLRSTLVAVGSLEIAGYTVSLSLIESLSRENLINLRSGLFSQIVWFEIGDEQGGCNPAIQRVAEALGARFPLSVSTVTGDAFWNASEISTVPVLIEKTVAALGPAV